MHISDKGLDLIKGAEGEFLVAYWDSYGKIWTIGWGHTGPDVYDGLVITKTQAIELLRTDCIGAENDINRLVTAPLNQNQFDALVSFTFNLGGGALGSSTLLTKLNNLDYIGASKEFAKWIYAGGVILKGLVTRRENERLLFMSETAPIITPPDPIKPSSNTVRELQNFLNSSMIKDSKGQALIVDGNLGTRTTQATQKGKTLLGELMKEYIQEMIDNSIAKISPTIIP